VVSKNCAQGGSAGKLNGYSSQVAPGGVSLPITFSSRSAEESCPFKPYLSGCRVETRLEFVGVFVIVTLLMGLLAPLALSAPNLSDPQGILLLVLAWSWLYGTNVITTMWRFPRWIRRTLQMASSS
jgi:hypothetical protein